MIRPEDALRRDRKEPQGRFISFSAPELLGLGLLLTGIGAWLMSIPAVVGAALLSMPTALVTPVRDEQILRATPIGLAAALLGGLAGSVAFGEGGLFVRAIFGVGASIMLAPVIISVLMFRHYHIHHPRASA